MAWSRVQYQHAAEVSKTSRSWTSLVNKYEKEFAIINRKYKKKHVNENCMKIKLKGYKITNDTLFAFHLKSISISV